MLQAVRQKQEQLQSANAAPAQPAPAAAQPDSANNSAAPATTTAPRTTMTKEQRVAELLRRYKAEEISALEYRMERAKILSEP
jgi:hypothetical protein